MTAHTLTSTLDCEYLSDKGLLSRAAFVKPRS